MKCDEKKPVCDKCQHMKIECSYQTSSQPTASTGSASSLSQNSSAATNAAIQLLLANAAENGVDLGQLLGVLKGDKEGAASVGGVGGVEGGVLNAGDVASSPDSTPEAGIELSNQTSIGLANLGQTPLGQTLLGQTPLAQSPLAQAQIPNGIFGLAGLAELSGLSGLSGLSNLQNLSGLSGLSQPGLANLANLANLAGIGGLGLGQAGLSGVSGLTGLPGLQNPNLANLIASMGALNLPGLAGLFGISGLGSQNVGNPGLANAAIGNILTSNELYPGLHTLAADHQRRSQKPDEAPSSAAPQKNPLNITDLKLMYHYTTEVWPTITAAGILEEKLWSEYIPNLAFKHPFLMHSVLAFSATHLLRSEDGLDECVTYHRGESLRLLRDAVLEISLENTDALVASAIILIMDALANALLPLLPLKKLLPASAWIYHVKGAATILTAVWPLNNKSKFHKFISVDLSDLGDIINNPKQLAQSGTTYSDLKCFDDSIADLYPVEFTSPYLITLAYLDKLYHERYKLDFILRIFAFPALLDKTFLALLMTGDLSAMRIMRCYYTMLREFTNEMREKVWFLEGVCKVLPADVDEYSGGGGMHMMLDFLGGGLPSLSVASVGSDFSFE